MDGSMGTLVSLNTTNNMLFVESHGSTQHHEMGCRGIHWDFK